MAINGYDNGVIRHDTAEMNTSSSEMKNQAKTFIDEVVEAYDIMDELLDSDFVGDLGDDFRHQIQSRREAFEQMGETMNASSKEIDNDVETIEANQTSLKSMYDSDNYLRG